MLFKDFQAFYALLVVLVVLKSFLFLALLALIVIHDTLNNRDRHRKGHGAEAADQDVTEKRRDYNSAFQIFLFLSLVVKILVVAAKQNSAPALPLRSSLQCESQ